LREYAEKKQNGTWKNIETMPPLVNWYSIILFHN
jgi:hypothetical protein